MTCATHALFGASLLEQRIEHTIRTSKAIGAGAVGIEVVQLGTNRTLFSLNSDKLFVPASNTKLFTTAMALTRLGPDHRMVTRVLTAKEPEAGRIAGDLVLAGAGDPSMSFIRIPYVEKDDPADPMAAIEAFADQIAAKGVRWITGDIIGDDTAYEWEPFAPGWGLHDPVWEYGAPVSALNLGSNSIRVDLEPSSEDGAPAAIVTTPAFDYFVIDNRTQSAKGDQDDIEVRRLGPRHLQISGTVVRKPKRDALWLAVDDPALYAATALHDALQRRGIRIDGRPVARHRGEGESAPDLPAAALAERTSPPLGELIRVVDKVSQNLWAELMLREVAHSKTGVGSRKAGLKELQEFLGEAGISEEDYEFSDGSGLSRFGLVKPGAVVALLRYMYASPLKDLWMSVLPVGGEDGTLARRFGKDPAAKAIHAKTGSLSHVNALSGYVDSATFGELAFSILVNNTSAPAREVREFIDKIGMILLE